MGCDCFKSKNKHINFLNNGLNPLTKKNSNNQKLYNSDVSKSNLIDNNSNIDRSSNINIVNKKSSVSIIKSFLHKECKCINKLNCICKYIPPKVEYNIYEKATIQDFNLIKLIGEGAYGKVYLACSKLTKEYFAIKVLKKQSNQNNKSSNFNESNNNRLKKIYIERLIMEQIKSPFILKLEFSFQDKDKLYLVSEFAQCGDLFSHLCKENHFKEERAKFYICELILALEKLHEYNIIYRDIKPENILLFRDGHIKLTDFGLSAQILDIENNELIEDSIIENSTNNTNKNLNFNRKMSICGSIEYLAPEIFDGIYGKEVDWWSLGIVFYQMLTGYTPFKKFIDSINIEDKKPLNKNVYYNSIEKSDLISDDAYSFILDSHPQFFDHRAYRPWQINAGGSSDPDDGRAFRARDVGAGARQYGY